MGGKGAHKISCTCAVRGFTGSCFQANTQSQPKSRSNNETAISNSVDGRFSSNFFLNTKAILGVEAERPLLRIFWVVYKDGNGDDDSNDDSGVTLVGRSAQPGQEYIQSP